MPDPADADKASELAARRILSQLLTLRAPRGQTMLQTLALANHLTLARHAVPEAVHRDLSRVGLAFDPRDKAMAFNAAQNAAHAQCLRRLELSGQRVPRDVTAVVIAARGQSAKAGQ